MKQIACAVFLLCSGLAGVNAQRDTPVWVNRPSAVFPDSLFVSASGSGQDRSRAESSALGSLTAYFKQSVVNTITLKDSERQENGRSSSSTEAFQTIEAVSALDSLIGAEIKAVWNDERQKLWYAVAVMEKAKCAPRYSEEINKALVEINDLIDISKGVSFETISKCRRAQESLDKAGVLVLVHSMLGGWNRQDELAALSARITVALDQAKSIPVDVRVLSGDRGGRIRSAFAGIFTSAGFRTGSRNSRYTLEVTMTLSEAPKTQFYNTRYGINAVLKDTLNDMELFTYTITNRESHTQSQAEADNRAYIGAERKIKAEFPEVLREYMESY